MLQNMKCVNILSINIYDILGMPAKIEQNMIKILN